MENSEVLVLYKTCFALRYKKEAINIGQKMWNVSLIVLAVLQMNLFASVCVIPKFALHRTN